jgi:hypothetical protein
MFRSQRRQHIGSCRPESGIYLSYPIPDREPPSSTSSFTTFVAWCASTGYTGTGALDREIRNDHRALKIHKMAVSG